MWPPLHTPLKKKYKKVQGFERRSGKSQNLREKQIQRQDMTVGLFEDVALDRDKWLESIHITNCKQVENKYCHHWSNVMQ